MKAAKAAGLRTVPCVVAHGMSDAQALEAQLVENLQREGLDPLVESDAYAALLKSQVDERAAVEGIAARVGRSVSHVRGRLKLQRLHEAGAAALAAGDLDGATAQLVARIPRLADQQEAVKVLSKPDWSGKRPSHRDAKRIIATKWMRRVDRRPWGDDRHGMAVPGVGWDFDVAPSCALCPHRTGSAPEDYPDSDPWLCTRVECHDAKTGVAVAETQEQLRREGRVVVEADGVFRGWNCGERWIEADTGVDRAGGKRVAVGDLVRPDDVCAVVVRMPGSDELRVADVVEWAKARAAIEKSGGGRVWSKGASGNIDGSRHPEAGGKRAAERRRAEQDLRRAIHDVRRRINAPVEERDGEAVLVVPVRLARGVLTAASRWANVPDDWPDHLDALDPRAFGPMLFDLVDDAPFEHRTPAEHKRYLARAEADGVDVKRVRAELRKRPAK